jgi:hypothetical protein
MTQGNVAANIFPTRPKSTSTTRSGGCLLSRQIEITYFFDAFLFRYCDMRSGTFAMKAEVSVLEATLSLLLDGCPDVHDMMPPC